MKIVLGRKQSIRNEDWLDAMARIEEYVSREELDEAVITAVERIKEAAANKHVAYAWSGGKDSIVLSKLCEMAGIKESYFAHTELEYPAFLNWCMEHLPEGCTPVNLGYDLDWLVKHPRMLFPTPEDDQKWHKLIQITAFEKVFFEHNLDMLIVGHRTIDGNVCGPDGYIRKKSGEVRYSPIADWPHELILAFIHYYDLALPPIYDWKDGYWYGTHTWAERGRTGDKEEGYREVYEIDPSIVVAAAEKIESARLFLAEVAR